MNARKPVALGLASGALLLIGAGIAQADEGHDDEGYPSTQNPSQGVEAVVATLDNAAKSFADALNGNDRPDGANGTDTEFIEPDPRFVEGPVGGLLNGPFE